MTTGLIKLNRTWFAHLKGSLRRSCIRSRWFHVCPRSPALSTLMSLDLSETRNIDAVVQCAETMAHIVRLNEKALARFKDDSESDKEERSRNAVLRALSDNVSVTRSRHMKVKHDSLSEEITKTFHLGGRCVEFSWCTERHLLRKSTFDHHAACLHVDQQATVEVNETDPMGELVNGEVLSSYYHTLKRQPEFQGMSLRDFAWFMSFVCTHPSDEAFDVISRPLFAWADSAK